jgi:hypothetical protein
MSQFYLKKLRRAKHQEVIDVLKKLNHRIDWTHSVIDVQRFIEDEIKRQIVLLKQGESNHGQSQESTYHGRVLSHLHR